MPIRIDVSKLGVGYSATPLPADNKPCVAAITGLEIKKFSWKADGKSYTYPTLPAGGEEKDPVKWLKAIGWTVPGSENGEAPKALSGFSKDGHFTELHVEYIVSASCSCAGDKAKSTKRAFKGTIDYDYSGSGGPKFKLFELDGSGAEKTKLTPDGKQSETRESESASYDATQEATADIACPCDDNDPCKVQLTLQFTYSTKME